MDKETKAKYFSDFFCEDCLTDPDIECPRDKNVKCLICNKELCAYHMMKHEHDKFECLQCKEIYSKSKMPHHLKESHQISITWTGFKFEKKGGET